MKYYVFSLALLGMPFLAFLLCVNLRWVKYAFWGMVAAMCLYHATSINFFSHAQYSGSSRGMEVSLIHLLAFASLLAFLVRGKIQRLFPETGYRLYFVYFLLCLPSVHYAANGLIAWFEVWKMIVLFFFYHMVYTYLRATDDMPSVLVSLAMFTMFNFLVVARQHYGGIYQPAGVFPHRNCMGMAMLLFGPLFYAYYLTRRLKTKGDKFCAAAFPLAAVATFWSYSRGSIAMVPVAYGITTLACCWDGKGLAGKVKKLLPLVIAANLGIMVMLPRLVSRFENAPDASANTRVELAHCAWEMIKENPFFGVGINNWSINMGPEYPYQDRAGEALGVKLNYNGIVETVYLLIWAECGIFALLGFIVWLLWYWFICLRLLKRLRGTKWYFLVAGLLGGFTANYLQSALEWVLRQQLNLICLMFMFAIVSYLNTNWRKLVEDKDKGADE